MNALRQRSTSAEHRRLTVVATVALLGLVAISTTARADILTTFDFSGTLSGSPNANPPTVTGTFALDQTTGTLAGVDLNTPIGAFTGSTFDGIDSSLWQTVSGGTAFQLIYEGDGGIVGLSLGFAGTVDGFTGGSLLTQADFLQPGLPPQLSNPTGLESDSFVPACDGSTAGFELTGGVATPVTAPAVPEPGSLAFFGTGLVALASTLRTRRRSQPTADGE